MPLWTCATQTKYAVPDFQAQPRSTTTTAHCRRPQALIVRHSRGRAWEEPLRQSTLVAYRRARMTLATLRFPTATDRVTLVFRPGL